MTRRLQVALVSGPAYDQLYLRLPRFRDQTGIEVDIVFSGDHPSLNNHLASLHDVPYDLVSTHTKYAPSQLDFLAPLGGVVPTETVDDFMPLLLELGRVNGSLYGLPRNIDVRLLHYRTDLISTPPKTWDELYALAEELNLPPERYGF